MFVLTYSVSVLITDDKTYAQFCSCGGGSSPLTTGSLCAAPCVASSSPSSFITPPATPRLPSLGTTVNYYCLLLD